MDLRIPTKLIDGELDPDLVRKVRRWIAAGPLITPVAIALAFVNTFLSLLIYLSLPALSFSSIRSTVT